MGTIAQKLQNIVDSKAAISAAIEAKGGTVPTELTGYGAAIQALPSGGGSSDLVKAMIARDNTLTAITANEISGITRIGNNAFYEWSSLTSIAIPDTVTSIEGNAFNRTGIKSLTLPSSVTTISQNAFSFCSLSSITIPNSVTSIGTYAFNNSSSLQTVVIGNGINKIDTSTFQSCQELTSITCLGNLTSINNMAFYMCKKCTIFDFSANTAVPTLANTNAFNGTNANKKIIVPDALYDSWKAANNWNSSTNGIVDAITKASEA